MSNSILLDKSKALALDVIRLCNEVKTNKKECFTKLGRDKKAVEI